MEKNPEKRIINLTHGDFEITQDGRIILKNPELAEALVQAHEGREEEGILVNFYCDSPY